MFITVNHMIPILSFILPYLTAFKPIVLYRETASTKKESKKKKSKTNFRTVDDSLFNRLIYMKYSESQ